MSEGFPQNTRFVIFHRPGPRWIPDLDFREQPGVGEHVLYYQRLFEAGMVALGGPFLQPNEGGMMIPAEQLSLVEIENAAAADPAVQSGLLEYSIKPWLAAMRLDE